MYEGKVTNVAGIDLYSNDVPTIRLENRDAVFRDYEYTRLNYMGTTLTEIEYLGDCTGEWFSREHPNFYPENKYRIKPIVTKSPAQLEKEVIKEEMDKLSKRLEELDVE